MVEPIFESLVFIRLVEDIMIESGILCILSWTLRLAEQVQSIPIQVGGIPIVVDSTIEYS